MHIRRLGFKVSFQALLGKKAVVWNDFRWPHPPLAWADMLNMLDNESFQIAVPKTDGEVDYEWNRSGKENVICVLTSNDPIVYVSGNVVNKLETSAWNERSLLVEICRRDLADCLDSMYSDRRLVQNKWRSITQKFSQKEPLELLQGVSAVQYL